MADILEGVWPRFRDLSEDVSLLDLTPRWFKHLYSPNKQLVDQELETDNFVLDEPMNLRGELSHSVSSSRKRSTELTPLVFWLAEKRIREGMSVGLPIARRWTLRTMVPLAILVILWRKYPRSRKPITSTGIVLMLVYLISITRGLPGATERIFQLLNFTLYKRRGERPFRTHQSTGCLRAVVYALMEPFIPQVNVEPRNVYQKKRLLPRSPALSQASTEDPGVKY